MSIAFCQPETILCDNLGIGADPAIAPDAQQWQYTLRLLSGNLFDYLHPDPGIICIKDIAAGLAKACRYSG